MDKTAIRNYAVWARNELIARVTQKAEQYEITEKKTTPKDADSIGGRLLTEAEKNQRKALIEKIQADGFEQVMEEVAYTWFNRFTALRFMEVNNYLPSHTRVFTNESGEFKPQILADAIQLDLEGLNMDKVFELKDANKTEELYKYLLITQCNALSAILPRMFQKIEHYTELLLPDYLLREGSVIEQMIALIPEEDWTDQVQIIGWLYQYYNSEPKDAVFAAMKKNVKITKETIPAATQLFTPDWIVRYMVENSLGRLWLEEHPNDDLKSEWKYYLDEAEQEVDVQIQLDEIRKEYSALKPEEIRCIDPCMGSGHILCYMFDVLVKIYEDYGYTAREAVGNIIEKNLWGLDIDERAAQLSYFAVMMKARQYDRRFFNKKDENCELCIPQPHVYAVEESNGITSAPMHDMGIGLSQEDYGKAVKEAMRLVEEMHDAKEYGSIIHVTPCDWELLRRFAVPRWISEGQMRIDIHGEIEASNRLQILINIGETLSQKYDVVVTNPPYMGSGGMGSRLSEYVKNHYADSRSDMFSVFIERCAELARKNGMYAMITMHSWMFLQSFSAVRKNILEQQTVLNMLHLGSHAFAQGDVGTIVQTTSYVIRKAKIKKHKGVYLRLVDYMTPEEKDEAAIHQENKYAVSQDKFNGIPGEPLAYWLSDNALDTFVKFGKLGDYCAVTRGLTTGNNDLYLRFWFEVSFDKISLNSKTIEESKASGKRWFPHNKGGDYRTWYGNNDLVVEFENGGASLRKYYDVNKAVRFTGSEYYFHSGLTWTALAGTNSFRYSECHTFDSNKGPMLFTDEARLLYILGYLNSRVSQFYVSVLNPTLSLQNADMNNLPYYEDETIKDRVTALVRECVDVSKEDWDAFETSYDYRRNPIVELALNGISSDNRTLSLEKLYSQWKKKCEERYEKIRNNEKEINNLFIGSYGLSNDVEYEYIPRLISVRKAEKKRDIRNLVSFAVGCMMGRYSLDEYGIVYAGGEWNPNKYKIYKADADGIIPICDDEYFSDDIVGRFCDFIETVFGRDNLESNLDFIASGLSGKGNSRNVIRNYFLNEFYSDHCKAYQKHPIYWLLDSGKKNGFKCLIYVHRYRPDSIARIRTDYVHEQQSRYRTQIQDVQKRITEAGTSERITYTKTLNRLQEQSEELRVYEEMIHHLADQMISINMDDGIRKNYRIFSDVLAKI